MRYTIKDLLLATALVAVGVGGLCSVLRDAKSWQSFNLGVWIALCGATAFIGACLFFPFGRVGQGALWGFAVFNVVLLTMMAFRLSW